MKFSQMPYKRPDLAAVKAEITGLIDSLGRAADYAAAREAFLAMDRLRRRVETGRNLAYIRHSIDTRDAFYEGEKQFWNEAGPELEEYYQRWTESLLESAFRPRFAAEFGSVIFTNAELERKTFAPEIIPLLQKENELVMAYDDLIASARIPFRGGVYNIPQLGPLKHDPDDGLRLAAWQAESGWYKDHQPELDRIYDELVRLRSEMGDRLGHGGFTQLGYYRMERNCYTREDVAAFRAAVREYLVPVAESVCREQARRLGLAYPLSFADNALMFRSGNPKPQGGPADILAAGRRFYDSLSPETGEFFRMMLDNELLDVLSTPGKEGGGYCEALFEYEVPFIFANFNGTSDDVETVTHEAGHAFADWYNRKRVPMSTIWPSMEGCEVHSMSMEFFAWPWAEEFYGPDARKFRYSHLAGALTFIPYGAMVDHFQHVVYEQPELTPAQRHAVWKELLGVYMPWLKLDGEIPFYSEGQGWQRQSHIYDVPFYYIDYCLAQTVALSFWAMIRQDLPAAWQRYLAYTRQGGSVTFTELLANAGLDSPFDPACLRKVCRAAQEWLDAYDLTGVE
ncbi:MAG: M3 family oligoendopeptidase [Firmicutes bacterium]|nr:M3 family oligoendopeptidase [Bacillota bacterium]